MVMQSLTLCTLDMNQPFFQTVKHMVNKPSQACVTFMALTQGKVVRCHAGYNKNNFSYST